MTADTATTLTSPEGHADGLNGASEGNHTGEANQEPHNGSESPKGNREARYRVERNEARVERDALAQRIERMQTREIERIAGETLSNPADLLALAGKSLADFLDESGELDAELVTEAASELLSTRPGLAKLKHVPGFDPTQGTGGREPSGKREPKSLGDVIRF